MGSGELASGVSSLDALLTLSGLSRSTTDLQNAGVAQHKRTIFSKMFLSLYDIRLSNEVAQSIRVSHVIGDWSLSRNHCCLHGDGDHGLSNDRYQVRRVYQW